MDVSENRGTSKSSILKGFSIINHAFWGTPIFGNTHIITQRDLQSWSWNMRCPSKEGLLAKKEGQETDEAGPPQENSTCFTY